MTKQMSSHDASRIQSAGAKQSGGQTAKDSFAARAQSAAARNAGATQGAPAQHSGKK